MDIKLDFDIFPLNIYKRKECESLLRSISEDFRIDKTKESSNQITAYFVRKINSYIGADLLNIFSKSAGYAKSIIIQNGLQTMISQEIDCLLSRKTDLISEARFNLIVSFYAVNDLLSNETGSFSYGTNVFVEGVKSMIMNFSITQGFSSMLEDNLNIQKQYKWIAILYFLSFLLNYYFRESSWYIQSDVIKLIKNILAIEDDNIWNLENIHIDYIFFGNDNQCIADYTNANSPKLLEHFDLFPQDDRLIKLKKILVNKKIFVCHQ